MSTVDKTFAFLSDVEGLAVVSQSGSTAMSYYGSDGSPASGCLRFTNPSAELGNTLVVRQSTSQTWEDWGVPAGATVTHVQLVSGLIRDLDNFGSAAHGNIGVCSPAGVLCSGTGSGYLADAFTTGVVVNTWTSIGGLNGNIAVSPAFAASNTPVCLTLTQVAFNGGTNADLRLDTFLIRITYTGGPATIGSPSGGFPPSLLLALMGLATATIAGITYLYADSMEPRLYAESLEPKLTADSREPTLYGEWDFS